MTIRAAHFTPQVLLSAPRRSAGIPNPTGTKIIYTSSSYSFDTHKKTAGLYVLSVSSNESKLITNDEAVSEPVWVEDDRFLVLKSGKDKTEIVIVDAGGSDGLENAQVVGAIDAAAANLKTARLDENKFAVVVSAEAGVDGKLFRPSDEKTHSSGRLYKGLFVRHWDEWIGTGKNALWYNVLAKGAKGQWSIEGEWKNALAGGEKGLESPIRPFGGKDSFDVSPSGIIFVSKDPSKDPALNTTVVARVIDLKTFREDPPKPEDFDLPGFDGAKSSPVYSPDGKRLAYLAMRTNGYESDRNEIMLSIDIDTNKRRDQSISVRHVAAAWDRSPSSITFTADGKALLLIAEEAGTSKVFVLGIDSDVYGPEPRALTNVGSVSDAQPLASGNIFISASSLTDNSWYSIIASHSIEATNVWSHSVSRSGSSLGLSSSQVSSIWSPASNPKINRVVHSWVVRPSFYDPSKKYPLAFLIHGGPQGAWTDSWSTRWNPAVFAEQGYIVVSPNPTGSTSFGQAFTDAIRKDWGGAPYEDLVNVFNYVETNLKDVDTDNAVALGASYGGYMVNWINGHDLGRRFKALVCHDGIFSVSGLLATEELYFPFHDLGGLPFYHPDKSTSEQEAHTHERFGSNALKYWIANDPSQHLHKWTTPQLVIHSSRDYRLAVSEGLSAFNVLQARGVDSQFLHFPDENHWVLKPENSLLWHKTVFNWINKFTGLPQFADGGETDCGFYGDRVKEDHLHVETHRRT